MNDEMSDDVEARAVVLAVGLLSSISDAKAAKQRVEDLVAATKAHNSKLAEAAATLEAVAKKEALFRQADEKLSMRIAEFEVVELGDRKGPSFARRSDS